MNLGATFVIAHEFATIPVGTFTWASLLIVSVLFALVHHLIIAAFVTSVACTMLLYRTRSIVQAPWPTPLPTCFWGCACSTPARGSSGKEEYVGKCVSSNNMVEVEVDVFKFSYLSVNIKQKGPERPLLFS
jgi:hypothetical protein